MADINSTAWATDQGDGINFAYIADADLPGSATTVYTQELSFLEPNTRTSGVQGVVVEVSATAVSGTNLDIDVHGSREASTSSSFALPGISGSTTVTGTDTETFKFDLKEYPMPYFYIAVTTDTDESANDITIRVYYQ